MAAIRMSFEDFDKLQERRKNFTPGSAVRRSNPEASATVEKKPARKSKFGNTKIETADGKFDSKKEYERWLHLSNLAKRGIITDLRKQVRFPIVIDGERVCTYVADFEYMDENRRLVVEDVKSDFTRKNAVYRLKKKLMKAVNGIDIFET